jgi:predicted metal-binding membrane protein
MLLMFVLGSLGWMLLLAGAMAVEKNCAWSERLGAPLWHRPARGSGAACAGAPARLGHAPRAGASHQLASRSGVAPIL